MKDWNHNYAQINGIHLHYVQEGKGDQLIVMLHGWPEFWYCWKNQIEAFSPQYTVVAPDLRGFNESEIPSDLSAYTQDIVGKDIVELIRHLGFEKVILVGHDWGGAIAWHIALNYPDLVEKFIVLNCPHPALFIKNIRSNPFQLLRSWYMFFFQLPLIPEFLMSINRKEFFTRIFRGWALNESNFPDEVIEKYVEAYSRKGTLTGGVNYYRANIRAVRSIAQSKSRRVKAPTLVIWGDNDVVLGTELIDGTEKYIDNTFTVKRISGASHWVQNDCPEEVNKTMLEFMAET